MKKFVLLLAMLPFISCAQTFTFGLKGGLNLNRLVFTQQDFTSSNYNLGYTGGLFFIFQSEHFYLQPEIILSQKNGNYKFSSSAAPDTTFLNKIDYVDIPMIGGIRFGKHFKLGTGPIFYILTEDDIKYKIDGNSLTLAINDKSFKTLNFGWQTGICIEVAHFLFEFRYEYGINHLIKEVKIPKSNTTLKPIAKNNLFQLTVGLRFL
ncbi:MAG: porin family protein [Bacteroidales bacterium]|jgi:hypothetical protein